jgi:hypothetical protein
MNILCVEPGQDYSTMDVYLGLTKALENQGHRVGRFATSQRLVHATRCMELRWKETDCNPIYEPTDHLINFHACQEIVTHALYHEVDWVLFVSCGLVHPLVFTLLKRAGIKQAMLLTESPNEDDNQALYIPLMDIVWTNDKSSVERLHSHHPNVRYLPHAYDPEVHCPGTSDVGHDVVFIGTLWQERIDLFSRIDWSGIDFAIYAGSYEVLHQPKNRLARAVLEPYTIEGATSPELTLDLYRGSKIGINLHRRFPGAYSLNPRCYQQPAVGGALLLSDRRPESKEVFGDLLPWFDSRYQLKQLIDYYLEHESERRHVVGRMRECVTPHTFDARACQLVQDLESVGGSHGYSNPR